MALDIRTTFGRYRGKVLWIDLMTGDTIEGGIVERAIVRSTELVVDVRSERGEYTITLTRAADGEYQGTWRLDRSASRGRAGGRWHPNETGGGTLLGTWGYGTVIWGCVLEPVETFES